MIKDEDIPKVVDALIYAVQHPTPRDPNKPLKDYLGRVFKTGEKVAVALSSPSRGTYLDIAKLDTVKDRILIDWSESPIRNHDIRWDKKANDGKGDYVSCDRRKSWVYTLNVIAIDS